MYVNDTCYCSTTYKALCSSNPEHCSCRINKNDEAGNSSSVPPYCVWRNCSQGCVSSNFKNRKEIIHLFFHGETWRHGNIICNGKVSTKNQKCLIHKLEAGRKSCWISCFLPLAKEANEETHTHYENKHSITLPYWLYPSMHPWQ